MAQSDIDPTLLAGLTRSDRKLSDPRKAAAKSRATRCCFRLARRETRVNNRILGQASLDNDDEAPDLTLPPWREKLDAVQVVTRPPKSPMTKASTAVRRGDDKKR